MKYTVCIYGKTTKVVTTKGGKTRKTTIKGERFEMKMEDHK